MSSEIVKLHSKGLIKPPPFVVGSTQYEVMMGSVAYGVNDDTSDCDVYGFCIPPKETVFPHLAGHIEGFGKKPQGFDQYQQHHVIDKDRNKEFDFSIYNIVKFFQLCMQNNPNMIDSLFVPARCVLHITKIGHIVKDNRRLFLHKGAWHKFKGYAYSQIHKAKIKSPEAGSKRKASVDKFGWDVKFGYHTVRLISEVEQILEEGDLELGRNREHMKAIRRGEVSFKDVEKWFQIKEKELEKLYSNSKLQHSPDEYAIRAVLLQCLEEYFGSLVKCVSMPGIEHLTLKRIQTYLNKYFETVD